MFSLDDEDSSETEEDEIESEEVDGSGGDDVNEEGIAHTEGLN